MGMCLCLQLHVAKNVLWGCPMTVCTEHSYTGSSFVKTVFLVVSFLLGKSPASVYYCMPTFRNSLSVPPSKMKPIEISETSAYNNTLTPGTYPKEKKLQSKHGGSLESRTVFLVYWTDF